MPTYQYACTDCDHRFETVQSFSEDSLTECPQCTGRLRKLFNAVGIVFKGSGFYRTDSRSGSAESSGSKSGSGSGESGGSGSTDSSGSSGESTSGGSASGSGAASGSGSTSGSESSSSTGSESSSSKAPAAS